METSPLRLIVPRSLHLCVVPDCGALYLSRLLQEAASLRRAEQGTDFIPSSSSPTFFFFLTNGIWFYPRSLGYLVFGSC